jgi:DNA-binding transcriptional LysR family regulator
MRDQALFDKIDLHLIRVLHTVLIERSVSRAASGWACTSPQVSAALKRLRELAGDPLLVRSGAGMVPTDAALRMIEPSASILRAAEMLFSDARGFDPPRATTTFRVAASDYLDPLVPSRSWWRRSRAGAALPHRDPPAVGRLRLPRATGPGRGIDVVIGNWLQPPGDLHMGRSCSPTRWSAWWRKDHPAVRRGWDRRLAGGRTHRAHAHPPGRPRRHRRTPGHAGPGAQHHGALPALRPDPGHGGISLLVLTTGRQFCERFAGILPVTILPNARSPSPA